MNPYINELNTADEAIFIAFKHLFETMRTAAMLSDRAEADVMLSDAMAGATKTLKAFYELRRA